MTQITVNGHSMNGHVVKGHVKSVNGTANGQVNGHSDEPWTKPFPPFDALPLDKDGPEFNAWGLYGPDDELGRVNLITPEVVKSAVATITEGLVINLNLPIIMRPPVGRRPMGGHEIIWHKDRPSIDDVLHFNTQSTTQWDGIRHHPYRNWPKPGQLTFYNRMHQDQARDPNTIKNGVHNFAKKPITSRAHLLDIVEYNARHNIPFMPPLQKLKIPLSSLIGCAADHGIEFVPGDILLVRTGFTEAFDALSPEQKESWSTVPEQGWIGVETTVDSIRWHWENGFAAVAADCGAYEQCPFPTANRAGHEVYLAGWGMPLGECFDLRELARECKRLNKYTFMFTSIALNVLGGIATPPNAQAIL